MIINTIQLHRGSSISWSGFSLTSKSVDCTATAADAGANSGSAATTGQTRCRYCGATSLCSTSQRRVMCGAELANQAVWMPLQPSKMESSAGSTLAASPWFDSGQRIFASNRQRMIPFDKWPRDFTAIRIDALPDDALPKKGPGRGNGNFVLSEFK